MAFIKKRMAKRLAISKGVGLLLGLFAFFMIPVVFPGADIYIRLAVLFWYITFGLVIGLVGVLDVHPLFSWFKMPRWFRGAFVGAWLNFVIVFFVYHLIGDLAIGTVFEGMSPFWLVLEGTVLGFIVDFFATKFAGDGNELCE